MMLCEIWDSEANDDGCCPLPVAKIAYSGEVCSKQTADDMIVYWLGSKRKAPSEIKELVASQRYSCSFQLRLDVVGYEELINIRNSQLEAEQFPPQQPLRVPSRPINPHEGA